MAKSKQSSTRHVEPAETIVAIATPLGEGGLGVVRLSGPATLSIVAHVFYSKSGTVTNAASHTLLHGWINRGTDGVDEAVAAIFRSPHSYTGEDVVELSCHGSPVVLKEVVTLCQEHGARLANPGEFTLRAFLNGKMDLSQAEAVADLIHATSSAARKAAVHQLQGQLSSRIQTLRKTLVDLLAHIEANLDFLEEDIPGLTVESMDKDLRSLSRSIEDLLATSLRGRIIREGIRVAILGKPNVGKSSLFNALLAHDRAIVTDIPGTTRDTLEERLQWGDWVFVFIDTAGLRPTSDTLEQMGAHRARRAQASADLILLMMDGSQPLTSEDEALMRELGSQPTVVALNKTDVGTVVTPQNIPSYLTPLAVVSISAKEGTGLDALRQACLTFAERSRPPSENAPVITNARHVARLEAALASLTKAAENVRARKSEETLAIDLRQAADELGAITGENVTEDVLTSIFSRFCIGK